jgi:hypothetical protein
MTGHIFIAPGDITQLSADAIAFSASTYLGRDGNLCSSFEANVRGFSEWYAVLHHAQSIPVELGSTYWMPLSAERKPHGVVVVVSTGGGEAEDKAGLAVRRAIKEAVSRLRESGRKDGLLIALPAFRVGRGGDHRHRLRSARAQLQAAAAALEEHDGVDVAFLTYTTALYRIFLEARQELLGPADADVPRYPALLQALQAGSCVLFVGAGLSTGAGMPGWDQLIARLREELKIAPDARVDHLDLAQWYREHFGKKRLAELLRTTFSAEGRPTLAHYLLMALPLRLVITTNYDHLLEQALTALKRHPLPVIRQEDVVHTGGAGVYVVKLHGDAHHPDEIVLTRDDYHTFFENRPAMALLLEGLLLNQTFFFVGYSLRDPNFQQLFSRIARMLRESRRPAFAASFEAKGGTAGYIRQQWRHQQLELISVAGDTQAEQEYQFLCFLDRLADSVTMQAAPLVLAPDVPVSPRLADLRWLLGKVGDEVEALSHMELGEKEVLFVAEVLRFLTAHGWRPSRGGHALCALWEELARRTRNPDERRRLLIAALSSAEAFSNVRRVREELDERRTETGR